MSNKTLTKGEISAAHPWSREPTLGQVRGVPRKERLRAKHPARFAELVAAATRVLSTAGYEAANVNRVAELAGVGVGTLYNYFDDKDDMFLTCVEAAAVTDFETKTSRVDPSAPALEMLRAIIRVDRELMDLDPDGQQLLKSVFYGVNSHLPVVRTAQAFYAGSLSLVEHALAKGAEEGVFALGGETRLVSLLVNGIMETYHVLGELLADDDTALPPAERALDMLCRGILTPEGRKAFDG